MPNCMQLTPATHRAAIDSICTFERNRSSLTYCMRTVQISSPMECPVDSLNLISRIRLEQPSSAITSLGRSPSQALMRMISNALDTSELARGSKRVDCRRVSPATGIARHASHIIAILLQGNRKGTLPRLAPKQTRKTEVGKAARPHATLVGELMEITCAFSSCLSPIRNNQTLQLT